jgi:2-keto-4-pentenoate hydratase/2-oxohepta-3-ene-1,7-dioic acid hydratase in catechol pathway
MALLRRGGLRVDDLKQRAEAGRPMVAPAEFEVPLPQPGTILCVARNYRAHARELGNELPAEPVFFAKLAETLVAHGRPVVLPCWLEGRVDHEAELGVVLGFDDTDGRGARYVDAETAVTLCAGYTIVNDVTARALQTADRDKKLPWLRSKSLDTFCPAGPFVVPADAISAADLEITLRVDGRERQRGRTSDMVFPIGELLAAMARCTTLRPGDLIATGTPAGVGPIEPGATMEVEIEGLGLLRNPVAREPGP